LSLLGFGALRDGEVHARTEHEIGRPIEPGSFKDRRQIVATDCFDNREERQRTAEVAFGQPLKLSPDEFLAGGLGEKEMSERRFIDSNESLLN
jgi:hypothetical protein